MGEPNQEEWRYPTWFLAKIRDMCEDASGEYMQWEQIEAVLKAYSDLTGATITAVDGEGKHGK